MKENRYRISFLQGSFPCKVYSVASCSTLIRLGVGIATENNGEALRELRREGERHFGCQASKLLLSIKSPTLVAGKRMNKKDIFQNRRRRRRRRRQQQRGATNFSNTLFTVSFGRERSCYISSSLSSAPLRTGLVTLQQYNTPESTS